MDSSQDYYAVEGNGDTRRERTEENSSPSVPAASCYRFFDRQRSIRQIMGGGKAADVILWKQWQISFGIIVVATVGWLLFEWSGISFLSICSDILLILVVIQFIRANGAALLNKQLQPLPELVLSEEMVNNSAASFRVKINYMLLMAHDITLGKDFRLFFKVVVCLWLLSVVGSFCSFFTLAYIGCQDLLFHHINLFYMVSNLLRSPLPLLITLVESLDVPKVPFFQLLFLRCIVSMKSMLIGMLESSTLKFQSTTTLWMQM
ncbi:reticulon-like protein B16 isoform X1 [Aristolochia californica]|uniref:reticulon-like protein B16 isoform X1 n=1 Tax=Aristolochia californica TaxID=171875 RepID=UPI0035E331E8